MASKILFNGSEVAEFLVDSEYNFMGVEWIEELEEGTKNKIQDFVEHNYLSAANKVPASNINVTTVQIG